MRVFALELDNDLKGIPERKAYIEGLIARLPSPELVVLPELALCSYMASQAIWQYADEEGRDAGAWAVETARTYGTFLGVGFLARSGGDYYNRYLIAGPEKGICYDSRRRHFYENVKDASLSMILFPHGAPADPKKPEKERRENDLRCTLYADAWGVPVVYVNSRGSLEPMPGKMGEMMRRRGFRMNGMTRIYAPDAVPIPGEMPEAVGAEVKIHSKRRVRDIRFYGDDILPGNRLFRRFVLKPDTEAGIKAYESNK